VNILILGGHGFLGLQLLNDLQDCVPFANIYISSSRREVVGDGVIFVDYDSTVSVRALFTLTAPDYIFHLASSCVRDSADSSLRKGRVRDDNILRAVSDLKLCSKFIFVGSMAVFSMSDKQIKPMKYKPESNYGLEKMYMINKLLDFSIHSNNVSCKVVYPSSIYGKGQDGKMFLPRLLENIQRNTLMVAFGGNKKRDFIHVKDVSRALVQLFLDYDDVSSQHIFLHSFVLYKISEIANFACSILRLVPKEVIIFQDSREDLERDLMDFQIVDKKYCSSNELTTKISILEGLQEMFGGN
tara:strand:+ start:281 stop:1177 length:897 start_codon:yes stop_codon:yes gene_type:complete